MKATCVCGNPKSFESCCGRFLNGKQFAKTPEQLMRSRFSAYALGGYGEYLLATWFPATAAGLTAAELSQRNVFWKRLEVLSRSQKGDDGIVEFKAWFTKQENGDDVDMMHERSVFKRNKGRWYYVGGEVQ